MLGWISTIHFCQCLSKIKKNKSNLLMFIIQFIQWLPRDFTL